MNWKHISQIIDIKYVERHQYLEWDRTGLSMNEMLTVNAVKSLHLPNATGEWNWDYMSQYMDIEEILSYPDEKWNLRRISMNKSLTINILKNLYLPNAVGCISSQMVSRFINAAEYINHPDYDWNPHNLYYNDSVTLEHMNMYKSLWNPCSYLRLANPTEFADLGNIRSKGISCNVKLTIDIIRRIGNINVEWDWELISEYINIDEYYKYPGEKWSLEYILLNKTVKSKDLQFFKLIPYDIPRISPKMRKDVTIQFK